MSVSWLSQSETDLPPGDRWLSGRERERAAAMRYAKRRDEFLLARWTAKRAVARVLGLGVGASSLREIEIGHANGGAPQLHVGGEPAPLEISLSDRAGWAVCALASPGGAIGCDLELVEPRSDAFVADYLTESERALVHGARGPDERDALANLLWCAKESALKVLRTGLRRDTRSVEVRLGEEERCGWRALTVHAEEGSRFPGWWQRYGAFLLSFASEASMPPPTSLVEPPGLASGVPRHSWMAAPLGP